MKQALTKREKEVLALICEGKSYKEIAAALDITVRTVRFHVPNILHFFDVDDRYQLLAKAARETLIEVGA